MADGQLLDYAGLAEHARALAPARTPVLIGVDGRSGVGKSTVARDLARELAGQVIEGDAFFAGGVGIHTGAPAVRAEACIDRLKLCGVLAELKGGRSAKYRPFDWDAFDGRLHPTPVEAPRSQFYVIEGVYVCHPDLHAHLDIKALAHASSDVREARLLQREGSIGPWEKQWHEAEDWYFSALMPPDRFDVLIDTSA